MQRGDNFWPDTKPYLRPHENNQFHVELNRFWIVFDIDQFIKNVGFGLGMV